MAHSSRVPAVLEKIKALQGHASQITLDLPEKRNALSAAMVSCLQDCLKQLQASTRDLTCRGILLRSNVEGMQLSPTLMICPVRHYASRRSSRLSYGPAANSGAYYLYDRVICVMFTCAYGLLHSLG
jgi:hypothetical protein